MKSKLGIAIQQKKQSNEQPGEEGFIIRECWCFIKNIFRGLLLRSLTSQMNFCVKNTNYAGGLTFLAVPSWIHSNSTRGLPSALKSIDLQIAARARIISAVLLERRKTVPVSSFA